MQEKPLRYISLFRDKKLICLIRQLRERGAKIVVYSDYPAKQKIEALRDLAVDYYFCADDKIIQCLKPETRGLANIVRAIGELVEYAVFIGDRCEKDGKCAEGIGMDYIILDKNPILRNSNLYKKNRSKNAVLNLTTEEEYHKEK
jgi:FMN phosphatase YigB (HAD superfamily)